MSLYSNPSSDHGRSAVPGAPTSAAMPISSAVDDDDDDDDDDDHDDDCLLLPLFSDEDGDEDEDDDDDGDDERWSTAEDDGGRCGAAVNELHPREAARTGRRARDILIVPGIIFGSVDDR